MMKLSSQAVAQVAYGLGHGLPLSKALRRAGIECSERHFRRLLEREPVLRLTLEDARQRYRRRGGKRDLVRGLTMAFRQVGLNLDEPIQAARAGLDLATLAASLDAWSNEILNRCAAGVDVNLPDQPDDAWIDEFLRSQPQPPPDFW